MNKNCMNNIFQNLRYRNDYDSLNAINGTMQCLNDPGFPYHINIYKF